MDRHVRGGNNELIKKYIGWTDFVTFTDNANDLLSSTNRIFFIGRSIGFNGSEVLMPPESTNHKMAIATTTQTDITTMVTTAFPSSAFQPQSFSIRILTKYLCADQGHVSGLIKYTNHVHKHSKSIEIAQESQ